MNMKEVQLLGILAVIAGGIIVLSLWGSQPNRKPSKKDASEDVASGTVATSNGSNEENMKNWEWLTKEQSSEPENGLESTSTVQSDEEEGLTGRSPGQNITSDTTNRTAQVDDVAADIEETAPVDIGMRSDEADDRSEEEKQKASPRTHEVKKGETLVAISKKHYGTRGKWKKIFDANKDVVSSPEALHPGMELVIPPPSDAQSVAWGDAEEKPLLSAEDKAEGAKKYTVKKGDTLWSLSKKFYNSGQKHKKILKANDHVKNKNDIHPGIELIIPE